LTGLCDGKSKSDDQKRHTDAKERKEENPDDREDATEDQQQPAGAELRQFRPSALRGIRPSTPDKNVLATVSRYTPFLIDSGTSDEVCRVLPDMV